MQGRDLKTFAAANVLASDHVIAAHHVRLRFGKTGTVSLVGVPWKGILLATYDPRQLVIAGLPAVGASECMGPLLYGFIKEIALFHDVSLSSAGCA